MKIGQDFLDIQYEQVAIYIGFIRENWEKGEILLFINWENKIIHSTYTYPAFINYYFSFSLSLQLILVHANVSYLRLWSAI